MDAETLLPLVTFILGLAGALATEAFRDRRASNRERQARQAELQRSTLLELQDVLLELSNLASHAVMARHLTTLEHPDEASRRAVELDYLQAEDQVREASRKADRLISRVLDDQARKDATEFSLTAVMVAIMGSDREGDIGPMELRTEYGKVMNRLGELIRERY